jgi:hypothetical protein
MFTLKHALLSFVIVVAATLGSVGAAGAAGASSAAAPYCGITWGSLPKVNNALSSAALVDARTGQHDCYDRVVFEFGGPATGYSVGYADQVYSEGKGAVLGVAGGAKLAVHLQEPSYDVQSGAATYSHNVGDHVANVGGYRTLRDVVYGGSFEGYTTFGVGTRARLPFRVFQLSGPGTHSRIVIDVAHQWAS